MTPFATFQDEADAADPRWRSLELSAYEPAQGIKSYDPHLPLVHELPKGLDAYKAFQAIASLPFPLFMDSSLRHPTLGRYSYVAADPFGQVRCRNGVIQFSSFGGCQ